MVTSSLNILPTILKASNQRGRQMSKELELKWKLTYGALSLLLSALATRLALYLTNKIWGEVESLP